MSDPTQAEILHDAIARRLADLHTMLPGTIKLYNPLTGLAEVEIMSQLQDEDPIPPLADVPVQFPSWGGFQMQGPVNPGDECMLLFAEVDMSRFMTSGSKGEAQTVKRHGLYAVAVMGGLSSSGRNTQLIPDSYLHVGEVGGTEIAIQAGEVLLGSTDAAEALALASAVETELNDLKNVFTAWVPVALDGGAALKTAVTPWAAVPALVGSDLVKADS